MIWARLSKSLPCSWSLLKETALQKGLPLGACDSPTWGVLPQYISNYEVAGCRNRAGFSRHTPVLVLPA